MTVRKLDWTNTLFIVSAHLMAAFAVVYVAAIQWSWWTMGLGLVWLAMCSLSITGGYHRLFAHSTYKTVWPLRALYLFFGAASVQNSALKWSADHRVHHARTDEDEDPYNIQRGFWWAHIGWVFFKDDQKRAPSMRDLHADRLVVFQDRWYIPLAILSAVVVPAALGLLWGDPLGAVLVCGFMRLVIQWHMTFSVNSFAHLIGRRPFCTRSSARDSFITAMLTLGEGYHNFHHRFAIDYRNGFRWYHIDPTKWFVWLLSRVGLTWDLKRTPREAIQAARLAVRATKALPD
jgi:stearoyl-CoA desaturase (delta-9 desaturase)